ncbi:MAG: Maf family nucleotide pyrophosphatase [Burkholderiaceae bacterium]
MNDLILASSSVYRQQLLSRLRIPFTCVSPNVDEKPLPGEQPVTLACRLAKSKAEAVATQKPGAVVIGSDQIAVVDGVAISKPGNHDNARRQLQSMRGRTVIFYSAVSVIGGHHASHYDFCVPTEVSFRDYTDLEIESYLHAEKPYDCAGSAKSEGLGITLLERIESSDPTALIGLPLIELAKALRRLGFKLP